MLSSIIRTTIRNMSSPSKLIKMNKYIGTHDNTFHCDDVTACFMLKQLDRFKDHEIIRTRDKDKLDSADIVVDVGSELNIETLRLDHHQYTFQQTIKDYHPNMKVTNPKKPVRLSSSGLVYALFGKDLIVKLLNLNSPTYKELTKEEDIKMVDAIFQKAYIEFFEEIDAIDNGVEIASGDNLVYNYHISSGLSNRVGRLNPLDKKATPDQRLKLFHKAMELVGSELIEGIQFLGKVWWPAREQFRQFIEDRKELDPSGQIVHITGDHLIGWKSALFDFEEELGIVGELKYIIYEESGASESPWRVLAVPVDLKSFTSRVPLKKEWCGKRNEELQEISGVPDATFVHNSGFTGGAKSKAGVMSMIRQTLSSQ